MPKTATIEKGKKDKENKSALAQSVLRIKV
jgi:hypothetical protein